tara:strand:+ start:231 stop:419 length:189 start_codon:yes stop_codon:yes gene_type:complete
MLIPIISFYFLLGFFTLLFIIIFEEWAELLSDKLYTIKELTISSIITVLIWPFAIWLRAIKK